MKNKKKGQTIVEWFTILALVSIIVITVLFTFADKLKNISDTLINKLTQVNQASQQSTTSP